VGAVRLIVQRIHTVWTMSPRHHEQALTKPVSEQVKNAVALGVLTREMEASIDIGNLQVRYVWGENGRTRSDLCVSADSIEQSLSDGWRLRIVEAGICLMRCLPYYAKHPLLKLVPKRSYQVSRELLPTWYVRGFDHDRTQLDGTVLCICHDCGYVWFQLPHSGPFFRLEYRKLEQSADKILSLG
jgi:hypothetical protein